MSVSAVLRADLSVLRRSKLAWGVFIVLLVPIVGAFYRSTAGLPAGKTNAGISAIVSAAMIVIPITALVASAFAIAAERETGTIRFLLGFPNERFEVVLGKVISRATLVNGALALGFLAVALIATVGASRPRLVTLGQFALLTMLFATSYVGLAVGISAAVTSQIRAIAGVVGSYLFWSIFWLPGFPYSASMFTVEKLEALLGGRLSPSSIMLVEIINPPTAYIQTLQLLGPTFENMARGSSTANTLAPPSVVIGVLVAWTVVPLALGYLAFRRAEIN